MKEVEEMLGCRDHLITLQSKALLSSLEEAFTELETWKVEEWERQRLVALEDRMVVDDGGDHCNADGSYIDTSTFLNDSTRPFTTQLVPSPFLTNPCYVFSPSNADYLYSCGCSSSAVWRINQTLHILDDLTESFSTASWFRFR